MGEVRKHTCTVGVTVTVILYEIKNKSQNLRQIVPSFVQPKTSSLMIPKRYGPKGERTRVSSDERVQGTSIHPGTLTDRLPYTNHHYVSPVEVGIRTFGDALRGRETEVHLTVISGVQPHPFPFPSTRRCSSF